MDNKSLILDFINKQKLTVISTVNKNGKPQAAVVGFGQTDRLEIIFGTNNASRKYQNILDNPAVALVIGWEDTRTVQFEGIARELTPDELQLVRDNYWDKSPEAEKHHTIEGQRYFIVKPTWIRYTDLAKDPWAIIELEF